MTRTRFTVWDAATDEVLIVCGTAQECAKRLDLSVSGFYKVYRLQRQGKRVAYVIQREVCDF